MAGVSPSAGVSIDGAMAGWAPPSGVNAVVVRARASPARSGVAARSRMVSAGGRSCWSVGVWLHSVTAPSVEVWSHARRMGELSRVPVRAGS
jgi:hypothetical protein